MVWVNVLMAGASIKANGLWPLSRPCARFVGALTLALTMAACAPYQPRESLRPLAPVNPLPMAQVPAEVPETSEARPALPSPIPGPAEAGISSPEAAASQFRPESAAPGPAAFGHNPAIPSQAVNFNGALIDRDRLLAEPFPVPLATALAGERLLLAHGLTPLREEDPDPSAAQQFAGPPVKPAALGASAPSAGELPPSGVRPNYLKAARMAGRTQNLLTSAYAQTGRHYKLGGFSPVAGFDAPGYTRWVFAREGLNLPKTPAALASAGTEVARADLRPGDVLIYRNPTDQVNGWHVGIYSGQGNFLHASPKAGVVTETDAFGPQYAPYFLSGRRFFDDPEAAPLSDDQKMAATSTAVKMALAELGPNDKIVRPAPPKSRAKAKPAKKAAAAKGHKAAKK